MEYKVLTKEDRGWTGKFSPENLEHTLNSYAAEGWRAVSSFPVASPWSFNTSQVMILLEREKALVGRRRVRGFDAVGSLDAEVVDVDPGGMGLHGGGELARPREVL